jgi:hypothetical protein
MYGANAGYGNFTNLVGNRMVQIQYFSAGFRSTPHGIENLIDYNKTFEANEEMVSGSRQVVQHLKHLTVPTPLHNQA